MDEAIMKHLLIDGGRLVLLHVPAGTEFGIDMKIFTTGENFRGVKMIPPGIHFIHYSALNKYGDILPKVGFFYNFRKSEFVVKKWDINLHDVSSDSVPECEIVSLKDNIITLDKFLGSYPLDVWKKWTVLSSHITESVIKRLTPEEGKIRSALDLEPCSNENRTRNTVNNSSDTFKRRSRFGNNSMEDIENELLPDLKPTAGTEIRFTPLPKRNFPEGSTPSQITHYSLDSTFALEKMLENYSRATDLIGELQFSYICFLVGHSIEAFEHWKNLVCLLCSCDVAITKYCTLYDALITTLEVQILETPEEFLADIVTNNNIVYVKLRMFFRYVNDSDVEGRFKAKVEKFKNNLTNRYEWDFTHLDSEDEEDAPVVLEL
ncbi:hypothetical protein RI129_001517 [Pyrocoelia pectoralis]|uniref:Protein AAR2 homolog n=1 Tax=Pyrocoelia pectoralis TaxID=417401 RepID=A0AAN7VXA6_9COLE